MIENSMEELYLKYWLVKNGISHMFMGIIE